MAASGRVYLQMVGTCTGDTFPSVMLFTDTERSISFTTLGCSRHKQAYLIGRYLFNCGEGVQRFCNEHRSTRAREY